MKSYAFYAGGEFINNEHTKIIRSSYDNTEIAKISIAGAEDLEKSILAGLEAEKSMAVMPSYQKYEILMQIAEALKGKRQYLGEVLCMEASKPLKLALAEMDRGIQTFVVAAEEAKRLPMEYMRIDWTAGGQGKEGLVKYFPVGLVAGISPFNFPLNLAAHKIAPAIAAGCPIILKPSSSTPLSTLELAEIIDRTSLPKGGLSVLPMDRNSGNLLVTDPRLKLLSFTGSPEVGWKMKNDAGKKKVVLELGGNAGVIITPSANIETAAAKCVAGGFSYSGQVCIHTQRIYVHQSVFSDFKEAFVKKTALLKTGNPKDMNTDITAMIDEKNALRVENWVNEAVDNGAKLLYGGKRNSAMIEPTILSNTNSEMKVCCCEIFGPVVVLESYSDFTSAVSQVNSSRFGLQAGVFTDSITEMDYAFNHLVVGGVMINEVPTFRVDHMPYGGVKDSGLGREGVKYAIFDMLEPRIMVK